MTRTTLVLLAMLGALAAAAGTPASAIGLNPQPLPPMPRCSPPCVQKPVIPAVTAPRLPRH